TDREFIDASMERIGVPFELAIVASEIGSYKPAHRHWEEFAAQTGADRGGHVHVAASLFHDVAPARELGLHTIWINRLGEEPHPRPDIELKTLTGLADSLDSFAS
ncbi:MAG: HAD family hydrolase, partial [Gaiellaceae bacterium]